jgi:hypothetical protein
MESWMVTALVGMGIQHPDRWTVGPLCLDDRLVFETEARKRLTLRHVAAMHHGRFDFQYYECTGW